METVICENAKNCWNAINCHHGKPHTNLIGCDKRKCSLDRKSICIKLKENKTKENKDNMNDIMNGYKVVREDEVKGLVSASVGLKLVKYAIGENAKPRTFCGPLTVFSDKNHVNGFIESLPKGKKYRVFKCNYVPTDVKSVHRLTVSGGLESKPLTSLPAGTMLAKSIYLTEEIFPTRF